ncbi:MAG: T9SS type A sorting domain-containing protein [Pseudoflavonifractor sp.]|nr:T9SS type A sorting domain-containing protein [Pseudoflavonifractor sp.]
MKSFLLSIMGASVMMTATAAVPQLTEVWTHSYQSVVTGGNLMSQTNSAIDANGNVYVAGKFNEAFDFAGETLEPIASSSYLLKFAADGSELWGVSLAGAATVTAVAVDADGSPVLAGVFADEVEFGSQDGNAVIKEGMKMEGAYTSELNASFIAKYTAEGNVTKVEVFVPESLAALVSTGMYFPEDGDEYFHINSLKVDGGKIYASAVYTGLTKCGNTSFEGSYMDPWGGFYFLNQSKASVFSLDADLTNCTEIASFGLKEPTVMVEASQTASSAAVSVKDGQVFIGFVGKGNMSLKAGVSVRDFAFGMELGADNDANEYGFVFAAVKGNQLSIEPQVLKATTTEAYFIDNSISDMMFYGNDMVVVGAANGNVPGFDANTTSGVNDVFVVRLDAASLQKVAGTLVEKSNGEHELDHVMGCAITGDNLCIATADENASGDIMSVGTTWMSLANNALTPSATGATGVSASDKNVFLTECSENGAVTFTMYGTDAAGIDGIISDSVVSIYPNPVADVLFFSAPVDVNLYTISGIEVKSASGVTSLSVADLPAGSYIVKANGKSHHIVKE